MKPADVQFYNAPFHATLRIDSMLDGGEPEPGDTIVVKAFGYVGKGGTVVSVFENQVQVRSMYNDNLVSSISC